MFQLSPEDKRVLVVSIVKALTAILQDNKHAQASLHWENFTNELPSF